MTAVDPGAAAHEPVHEPVHDYRRGDAIAARLARLVPGGSHTYSKGADQFPRRSPPVMARAFGAHCWDADGNQFIDWAMGNRVVILGHAWPAVNEAVTRQMALGLNFTRPAVLEAELAEYLVDLLPAAEMVKFGKNGSDVTTAAVKLARAATGRPYVAFCAGHPFFSSHDWFIGTTPLNAGVPPSDLAVPFPYNDLPALEALFARHPGQVAAVILEPVKNDAPHEGYLEGLRALTRREGAVLIFDEMIAGMRFDLRGAHHRWGVYPDLACYGKAMANGFSFSLLAGRRDLMELGGLEHDGRRVALLSQTHGAEATGLAACRATLDECRRLDVTRHVWTLGGALASGVRAAAAAEGAAALVRVIGFDCNPQIVCTRPDGTPWPALQTLFHEAVIARGVLIPWISVTWSHGAPELAQTLEAVAAGARAAARAVAEERVDERFDGPAVRPVFRPYNRCQQARCPHVEAGAPRLACCGPAAPRPVGAIVQARMGSTRLPGKVLLDVGGRPVLALLLERLARARSLDAVVVATTALPEDDAIVALCAERGVPVFRGSADDVLDRYRACADAFGFQTVVRITADCPLVDPALVDRMVAEFAALGDGVDLVTNRHPLTFPDGLDVDVMSRGALERAWREATTPEQREHTIPYFWEGGMRVHNVEDPARGVERHRWTLDYAEDYALIRAIAEGLPGAAFGTGDVLAFLAARPGLAAVNAHHMPPRGIPPRAIPPGAA